VSSPLDACVILCRYIKFLIFPRLSDQPPIPLTGAMKNGLEPETKTPCRLLAVPDIHSLFAERSTL
jgi:hypothetical protein